MDIYCESRLQAGKGGWGQCNRVLNRWEWLVSSDNNTSPTADVSVSSLRLVLSQTWMNLGSLSMTRALVCSWSVVGPGRGERWQIVKARRYDIVLHGRLIEDAGDTDGGLSVCFSLYELPPLRSLHYACCCGTCRLTRRWPPRQRSKPCFS